MEKPTDKIAILKFVNDLELKFPVYTWKYDGIDLWPIIRRMIFASLLEKKVTTKKNATAKNKYWNILAGFFKQSQFERQLPRRGFLFSASQAHRSNIGKIYYNRFCDPLMDLLNEKQVSCFLIEQSKTNDYYNSIYKPERFYPVDTILPWIDFKVRLKKRLGKNPDIKLPDYGDFSSELATIDAQLAWKVSFLKVRNLALRLSAYKKWAFHFLSKYKTSAVIQVCYYGEWQQALCAAAWELKIPVFDIQHGIIYPEHYAYARFADIPASGFTTLPRFFLTWSNYERSVINEWAQATPHSAVDFGNPWIAAFNDGIVPIKGSIDQWLEPDKPLILYTLGNRGENYPTYLVDFINRTKNTYQFWFRLHPRQIPFIGSIKEKLKGLGILEYVHLDEASNLPLLEILKQCSLHMTLMSSVAIEAAEFSIPSLILHSEGKQYYEQHHVRDSCYFLTEDFGRIDEVVAKLASETVSSAKRRRTGQQMVHDLLNIVNTSTPC